MRNPYPRAAFLLCPSSATRTCRRLLARACCAAVDPPLQAPFRLMDQWGRFCGEPLLHLPSVSPRFRSQESSPELLGALPPNPLAIGHLGSPSVALNPCVGTPMPRPRSRGHQRYFWHVGAPSGCCCGNPPPRAWRAAARRLFCRRPAAPFVRGRTIFIGQLEIDLVGVNRSPHRSTMAILH